MIYLEELSLKNCHLNNYVKWMNDKDVHLFTEQRFIKHSKADIKKFVLEKQKSIKEFLYGIFLIKNKMHLGNIKLGPINFQHLTSEISYFVGEKPFWGKGVGTLAIKEIILIAREKGLKKIKAGSYSTNFASQKILTKNGFVKEGILIKEVLLDGKRIDTYSYGKLL